MAVAIPREWPWHGEAGTLDWSSDYPLHHACEEGDEQTAQSLLKSGANVNERTTGTGWSALHCAAERDNTDCIGLLLERVECQGAVDDHDVLELTSGKLGLRGEAAHDQTEGGVPPRRPACACAHERVPMRRQRPSLVATARALVQTCGFSSRLGCRVVAASQWSTVSPM